jgi:LmbE family N-acetylglucosaminyl deacetylase
MSTIVCVFAHPDDEAFGPGGTIATYAKNNDVYIICATKGEQGQNATDNKKSHLATIREKEMLTSAKILGVKQVYFLDYIDGTLSNNLYHELADKVASILKTLKPEVLLTFEPRGVSGHLDHIAISMITSFVYKKLTFVKKLYYFCLHKDYSMPMDDYFIYFPQGYSDNEITTTIDISQVWDIKVSSMKAHTSQSKDAERILGFAQNMPKKEYFILEKTRIENIRLPESDLLNGVI